MKKTLVILFFILFQGLGLGFAQLSLLDVTVEGRENPLGLNTLEPRFSWKLQNQQTNVKQNSYRIRVSTNKNLNAKEGLVWDSGWVKSKASLFQPYSGPALEASTTYYFSLRVQDNKRNQAEGQGFFHTGLIHAADWGEAQWIAKEKLPDSLVNPLPLSSSKLRIDKSYELPVFRHQFKVSKKIKASYAYVSGLGHYEFYLNGSLVDDNFLQPGWTKYDKEAYYVAYDITDLLASDANSIGVFLGNGFYYVPPIKGRYQKHKVAFGLPKLKMKIVHHFEDGTTEEIITDETWKTHRSPITFSSIYGGEDYDANVLPKSWLDTDFDDSSWQSAIRVDGPPLKVQEIDPTRIMETFKPISQKKVEENTILYDFGQNASAIVSVHMRGNKGDTVRVYPSELLNEEGRVYQKWTGSPHYYEYVFGDEKEVTWAPKFTYYGFRYAELKQFPKASAPVEILDIQSNHIRNSTAIVGGFNSSDTLFNAIHDLIRWGIKSNMVSLFTDCPHREKLGWLEQLHLMGPSVQYNFNAQRLFAKSLNDMRNSQTPEGLVPETSPEYVQFDWGGDMFRDSPEWGSSSIILAWYAYQWYGDINYLRDNYDMMKKYIAYLDGKSKEHILYQGLSDWYDIGEERPGVSQLTPHGITATAIYYYNLKILEEITELLGKGEDKAYYSELREQVGRAFNAKFFDAEKGIYGSGSQTAQAMALFMDLVEPQYKEKVFDKLLEDIYKRDTSFTSGDVGHRYLIQVLHQHNRDDVIYAMHKNDQRPGYGYQIRKGATALTESWAALPNVSNNHFMLGHLMEWLYSGLSGVKQEEGSIGFSQVVIEPRLIEQFPENKVSFQTPYGNLKVDRELIDNALHMEIHIPVNSSGKVVLPKGNYRINGKHVRSSQVGEKLAFELGSGKQIVQEVL